MINVASLSVAAAVVFAAWLALTWYFADDEPALGPGSSQRVTFKRVLQGVARDVADLFSPFTNFVTRHAQAQWAFWGPRITNTVGIAVVSLDAYIVQTPELKYAVMQSPYGLAALVGLNLAASLSPRGAPTRVPPAAGGARGPGVEAATYTPQ